MFWQFWNFYFFKKKSNSGDSSNQAFSIDCLEKWEFYKENISAENSWLALTKMLLDSTVTTLYCEQ